MLSWISETYLTNWNRHTPTLEMLCAAVFGVPRRRCAWVTFTSSGLWVWHWCEWWTPSPRGLREEHAGSSTFAWEKHLWIYIVMGVTWHGHVTLLCDSFDMFRMDLSYYWVILPLGSVINKSCGSSFTVCDNETHTYTSRQVWWCESLKGKTQHSLQLLSIPKHRYLYFTTETLKNEYFCFCELRLSAFLLS